MTGEELHAEILEVFNKSLLAPTGMMIAWANIPQNVQEIYNQAAASIEAKYLRTVLVGNSMTPKGLDLRLAALASLPQEEKQKIYESLYLQGCRIYAR